MDTNKFFREATLRICGTLKISEAIYSAYEYIRSEIPIDRIFFQFSNIENQQMRIIANANREGAEEVDWVVPLSNEAMNELKNFADQFLPVLL